MGVRLSVVLLLALALRPTSADACICIESGGLKGDAEEAAAVFAGEIVALELEERTVQLETGPAPLQDMAATFRVVRRWKGAAGERVRVRTCGTQSRLCSCGASFQLGGHYIVFAYGDPLATGSCDRTTSYFAGDPERRWLGAEDLVRDLDALEKGIR